MTPLETLLSRFPGAKKAGNGWSDRCPVHDDRKASLSMSAGDDGVALLKCHAGCETPAILAAVGLKMPDLFPAKPGPPPAQNCKLAADSRMFATANDAVVELERKLSKRSALWTYHDVHGEPVGVVVRWDGPSGKDIRPVTRHGGGWRIGAMPDPRPLYNLPAMAAEQRVIVCEGEKASEAARDLGFVATTSAGGSQAAAKSDWRPLAGKEVWILPDNDAPGRKYADTVAGILAKLTPAPVIRVVELPNLPDGGDVVDWIDAHGGAAEPDDMRAEIATFARTVEPWRPDDAEDLAYRPFPANVLAEPIGGFVKAGARAIGCDPSYLALPLLTAAAAAIGNTRRLQLKRGWSAPPILWAAIVGESGTAKTPAFKLVMRPVRERQRKALDRYAEVAKQYEADLARWEKAMTAWKRERDTNGDPPEKPDAPQAERFIVSDTTVEALAPILLANPRGLLLARDELAGWMGSFDRYAGKGKASADSANWLSMFNAEAIVVDRKTGIPRTIYVPQAAVCVSGGIQPGILQRALGLEHRESGLAARLLVTCPPRTAKRWTEADIDPAAEAELVRLFDKLYELQPTVSEDDELRPVMVRLNADAKTAWMTYYNAHAAEQADLCGDMAAAWSKLEEYAARLALVVHFVRWAANDPTLTNSDIVDASSMNAGIALANWFKHEARRIYAMLDESETEGAQRRLIEWIGRKGGVATPREVQQGCRWLKESGAAETALKELVNTGRGAWQDVPTTAWGGRPSRAFVLSTPPTVNETPMKSDETESSVDVDSVDAPRNESEGDVRDGLFGDTPSSGPYADGF